MQVQHIVIIIRSAFFLYSSLIDRFRDALQFLRNDNRCDGINDAVERRCLSGGKRENVALIGRDRIPANASLLMKKLTERDSLGRFASIFGGLPAQGRSSGDPTSNHALIRPDESFRDRSFEFLQA